MGRKKGGTSRIRGGLRIGINGFHDGIGEDGYRATGGRITISLGL